MAEITWLGGTRRTLNYGWPRELNDLLGVWGSCPRESSCAILGTAGDRAGRTELCTSIGGASSCRRESLSTLWLMRSSTCKSPCTHQTSGFVWCAQCPTLMLGSSGWPRMATGPEAYDDQAGCRGADRTDPEWECRWRRGMAAS